MNSPKLWYLASFGFQLVDTSLKRDYHVDTICEKTDIIVKSIHSTTLFHSESDDLDI